MHTTSSRDAAAGIATDVRVVVVAGVVAGTPWQPDFALRQGALICAVVVITGLGSIRLRRADVFAILYAFLALASTSWAVDGAITWLGVKNTIACVVLFLTIRVVVRRQRDLRAVSVGLIAGSGVGIWQLWQENPAGRQLRLQYDSTAIRVGLEGLNFNALAYAFATGAATVVLLWATARTKARRRAAALSGASTLLILWAGVLLNGTRGAVIAMLALVLWLVVSHFSPKRSFHLLVGFVLVTNVLVFWGATDQLLRAITRSSARETGDLNGRLSIWPLAREHFWDRPFLGHGVDGVVGLSGNPLGIAAHNALLDVGVGLGIAGIALFVATIWSALAQAAEWTNPLRYVVVGSLVVVSTPIMLSGYWSEAPVFWIALGLFSSLGVMERAAEVDNLAQGGAFQPQTSSRTAPSPLV